MVQVTNMSPGVRILHVRGKDGRPVPYALQPKQSEELDLFDARSPIVRGFVASGDIMLGERDAGLDEAEGETADLARLRAANDQLTSQLAELTKQLEERAGPGNADPEAKKKAAAALLAKEKAGGLHFKTFEAEAKDILGHDTPSKKEDIIAALEKAAA